MKLPSTPISRWALNAQGDVYRLDGYVGIGTDSPGGLLGLGDSTTYITVNSDTGEITFSDAVNGIRTLSQLGGIPNLLYQVEDAVVTILKEIDGYASDITVSEHYSQLSEAIYQLRQAADAYGAGGTEQEHYFQQSQINQSILQALDGYAIAPSAGSGADGYIAFFTGPSSLAGDNDLYWDRVNNKLVTGPTIQLGTSTTKLTASADGSLLITNDAESAASGIIYLGAATSSGVRLSHSGNTFQVEDGAGLSTYVKAYQFFDSSGFSGYSYVATPVGTYLGFSNVSGDSRQNIDVTITRNAPGMIKISGNPPTSQYLIAGHNATDGYIGTDVGNLRLAPADNIVRVDGYILPTTDDAYSLGDEEHRWHDLWLGPGSLHIKSIATQTDTGVERDWNLGTDNTGRLVTRQGVDAKMTLSPDGDQINFNWIDSVGTFFSITRQPGSTGSTGILDGASTYGGIGITTGGLSGTLRGVWSNSFYVASNFGSSQSANYAADTTFGSASIIKWSSTSFTSGTVDLSIAKDSPGIIRINNFESGTQYLMVGHTLTDGYIGTNIGNIRIAPADNIVKVDGYIIPEVDDAYGLGSEEYRWRDLWLGPGSLHIKSTAAQTETGVERDWVLGSNVDGDLTINQDGLNYAKFSNDRPISIGTSAVTSHSLGAGGVIFGGNVEFDSPNIFFDGAATFQQNTIFNNDINLGANLFITFGNNAALYSHTTNAEFNISVSSSYNRNFIFTDYANKLLDHGVPLAENPTLKIFSNISPSVDNTQWMSISHNQTDGYIQTGVGSIRLSPTSNLVKVDGYMLPTTDDAYGLGNEEYRWRDLWLGPGSLHIRANSSQTETGVERDWVFGTNSDGDLSISIAQDFGRMFSILSSGKVKITSADGATGFILDPITTDGDVNIRNRADTTYGGIHWGGVLTDEKDVSFRVVGALKTMGLSNDFNIAWGNTASYSATKDIAIRRGAAGLLQIFDAVSEMGNLQARNTFVDGYLTVGPLTFPATHSITMPEGGSFALYNTVDSINYTRASLKFTSGNLVLRSEKSGGGIDAPVLVLCSDGTGLRIATFAGVTIDGSSNGYTYFGPTSDNVGQFIRGRIIAQTDKPAIVLQNTTFGSNFSAASGQQQFVQFATDFNQSGTAGYSAFQIALTETTTGSGPKRLIDTLINGVNKFFIQSDGYVGATGTVSSATNMLIGNGASQIIDTGNKLSILGDGGLAGGNAYFVATDSTSTHTTYQGVTSSVGFTGTFTNSNFEIRTNNAARINISNAGSVSFNGSSSVIIPETAFLAFGNTSTGSWQASSSTRGQFTMSPGTDHGLQLVFCHPSTYTKDFDHETQAWPVMFLQSSIDPDTDNTQWLSLYHDGTRGHIETGLGPIVLAPYDGYITPEVDDAYSLGSPTKRWKDLWLGPGTLHFNQTVAENDTGVDRDWNINISSAGNLTFRQDGDSWFSLRRDVNLSQTLYIDDPGGINPGTITLHQSNGAGALIRSAASSFGGNGLFITGEDGSRDAVLIVDNQFSIANGGGAFDINLTRAAGATNGLQLGGAMMIGWSPGSPLSSPYSLKITKDNIGMMRVSGDSISSQYLLIGHNSIDGYIGTDTGNLRLAPADNIVKVDGYILPEIDDAYSLGSEEYRWHDLWLGPGSLHIKSSFAQTDTGIERDWAIGADNNGNLSFKQDGSTWAEIDDAGVHHLGGPIGTGIRFTRVNSSTWRTDTGDGTTNFFQAATTGIILLGGTASWTSSGISLLGWNAWLSNTSDTVRDVRLIGSADASGEYAARIGTKYSVAQSGNLATLLQIGIDIDSLGAEVPTAEFYGDGRLSLFSPTLKTITLSHDNTNGQIQTDFGGLVLAPSDGYIYPFVDDAYSLGSPTLRWKDIWVGPGTLHFKQNAAENDTSVDRDWSIKIDSTGNLLINQDGDNALKLTSAGGTSIMSTAFTVSGTFNAPSFQTTASSTILTNLSFVNGPFFFSSSEQSVGLSLNTTFDQMVFVTSTLSGRAVVFGEVAYYTKDYDHEIQGDPAIFIHSATDPDTDNTQWLGFYHDKTKAFVETGLGSIVLAPYDGYILPAADDAYSMGSTTLRWKDLWLGGGSLYFRQNAAENDAGIERQWHMGIHSSGGLIVKQANEVSMWVTLPETGSLALGYNAGISLGQFNTAIGTGASASSVNGSNTAIGYNAVITNAAYTSVAIGSNASVSSSGASSVVIGSSASTSASNTTVIGYLASADASSSSAIAIGYNTMAGGANAIAIGSSAPAIASGAIAIGVGTGGAGSNSIAIGTGTANGSTEAVAIGTGAGIAANQGIAIGSGSSSLSSSGNGTGSIAVGYSATADGGGIAIGSGAIASNTASGSRSIAIGYGATTGTFTSALAIGNSAAATGNNNGQIGTVANPINLNIHGSLTIDGYLASSSGDLFLSPPSGRVVPGVTTEGLGNADNRWLDGYFVDTNTKGFVAGIVSIESVNSPYLAREDDYTIICDGTVGVITVLLPAAGGANKGRIYNIKKTDAINVITVQASGLENIDGANFITLTTQYQSRQIQSDGSNWYIIGGLL